MASLHTHPAFRRVKKLLVKTGGDALCYWDVGHCVKRLYPLGERDYG